jgi:2-dehydropantoate 2-reductase
MPDLRILFLGAGGIGGYFGERLAENGADVTFLVREGRRKSLIEDELRIESLLGNATLAVKTVMSAQVEPVYDPILLPCKAYYLDAAVDAIAPAVTPTGFVLPLLNGIAHMVSLNRRFGENRVLGGTAKIQAELTPGGAIRRFNDRRTITFTSPAWRLSGDARPPPNCLSAASLATRPPVKRPSGEAEHWAGRGSGAV